MPLLFGFLDKRISGVCGYILAIRVGMGIFTGRVTLMDIDTKEY
ncbi:hypothetical protein [Capnocytophaga gingivalis]|nr:hypothetical protein [Capnocytophaga gingivalis]